MKIGTILLLGISAIGFANVRSQQKCRERRRALQAVYGTTDPAELARRIRADGGQVPDCDGFVLTKEGI